MVRGAEILNDDDGRIISRAMLMQPDDIHSISGPDSRYNLVTPPRVVTSRHQYRGDKHQSASAIAS